MIRASLESVDRMLTLRASPYQVIYQPAMALRATDRKNFFLHDVARGSQQSSGKANVLIFIPSGAPISA
jgi:hypothetical protein